MNNENLKVDEKSIHIKIIPNRFAIIFEVIRRILNFSAGIFITYTLYDKCLFSEKCNDIVLVYLSLLSFVCFINCGVPVDKLIKINSFKG